MVAYVALYPEYGGPARGFRCETCERVTRTENGMKTHLRRVHGIKIQQELFDVKTRLSEGMAAKESGLSPKVDGGEASGNRSSDTEADLFAVSGANDSRRAGKR